MPWNRDSSEIAADDLKEGGVEEKMAEERGKWLEFCVPSPKWGFADEETPKAG